MLTSDYWQPNPHHHHRVSFWLLVNEAIRKQHRWSWSDIWPKSLKIPDMLVLMIWWNWWFLEQKYQKLRDIGLGDWKCWNLAMEAEVMKCILEQKILVSNILLNSGGKFLNFEMEFYFGKAWSNLTKLFSLRIHTVRVDCLFQTQHPQNASLGGWNSTNQPSKEVYAPKHLSENSPNCFTCLLCGLLLQMAHQRYTLRQFYRNITWHVGISFIEASGVVVVGLHGHHSHFGHHGHHGHHMIFWGEWG